MKGLIQQGMQSAVPEEETPTEAQVDSSDDQASPEDDENVERIVIAAQEVLYDDQTHPGIMKMLAAGKDNPAKALSDITLTIIDQLDEQAGGEIPEEAILPAAVELLTLVAELAQKSGTFNADEQVQGESIGHLFAGMEERGWIDEDDKQQIQQMLAEQEGAPA